MVTTVAPDGSPRGLTVNSFTSVSLHPPLISVCIDLRCSVLPALLEGSHFGVSVLNESQRDISSRFAGQCDSRFQGVSWRAGAARLPLLDGALAWFECRTVQTVTAGDHVLIIGAVEGVEMFPGKPLVYFASQYSQLAE